MCCTWLGQHWDSTFNLQVASGPKLKSLRVFCVATLAWTALKTVTEWKEDTDKLLRNDELPAPYFQTLPAIDWAATL